MENPGNSGKFGDPPRRPQEIPRAAPGEFPRARGRAPRACMRSGGGSVRSGGRAGCALSLKETAMAHPWIFWGGTGPPQDPPWRHKGFPVRPGGGWGTLFIFWKNAPLRGAFAMGIQIIIFLAARSAAPPVFFGALRAPFDLKGQLQPPEMGRIIPVDKVPSPDLPVTETRRNRIKEIDLEDWENLKETKGF